MPRYRVWDPMDRSEDMVEPEWDNQLRKSVEVIATEYGDHVAENGDSDSASGFKVHVRDLETNRLYVVDVSYDWEPVTCVSKAREVMEFAGREAV